MSGAALDGGHDIVVVGGSAGGIEALIGIVRELPDDLAAAIFVAIHFPVTAISFLPRVLGRASPLVVGHPADGEPIRCGHIYVAPPNRHLLVGAGTVCLSAGARENGHRPAIDPLFRSAARHFGPRVIAVVLSGMLGDGAAGLRRVRLHGGLTVVQDPADALFSDLPTRAITVAEPDHVVPTTEIPGLLLRLVGVPARESTHERRTRVAEPNEEPIAEIGHFSGEPARAAEHGDRGCPVCGVPSP